MRAAARPGTVAEPVTLDALSELMLACAKGDERALARLLTGPKLFALALSILKDRSHSPAGCSAVRPGLMAQIEGVLASAGTSLC
jgi:hypothetical protein